MVDEFDVAKFNERYKGTIQFSNNFCAYIPEEKPENINFIGIIKGIKEVSLGVIPFFLLSIDIAAGFTIDMLVAKENLKIELTVGKHIGGLAWLQGTLEKEPQNMGSLN